MQVLFLGPNDSPTVGAIRSFGDEVIVRTDKLAVEDFDKLACELLVSHGYRFLLKEPMLSLFPARAFNLHISLLPWNRGADPNFWSWYDDTPKGVSIHRIDAGLDTGELVAQREVTFGQGETLASSYNRLQSEIVDLLKANWRAIRTGQCTSSVQQGSGSYHRLKDKEPHLHLLTDGWQTPVSIIQEAGSRQRLAAIR